MEFNKVKTNILLCKPAEDTDKLNVFNSIKIRGGDINTYNRETLSFDIVTIANFWNIEIREFAILYSIIHNGQIVILGQQNFFEEKQVEKNKDGFFYDAINLIERFPVRGFPLKGPGIYQVVGHLVTNLDNVTIEDIRRKIESGNIEDTEEYMSNTFNFEVL